MIDIRTPRWAPQRAIAPLLLAAAAALGGCARDAGGRETARGGPSARVDTVDVGPQPSLADQLRAFQAGLARVDTLQHAASSRDTLVARLVAAIERRDTAAVQRMHLSRAEFAFLYYPSSELAHPPTDLDPETAWRLQTLESDKGIRRALDRLGGHTLGYAGYACADSAAVQGENRLWRRCLVRFRGANVASGRVDSLPLFGAIVERGGRFKFVNYWNKM